MLAANKGFQSANLLLSSIFIGSIFLIVWEIKIYQKTFIPLKIPFLIWLLTGLLLTPILRKKLAVYLETNNILLQIVYSIMTCGGFLVSAFMLPNYYMANKETSVINKRIISTGSLGSSKGGCRQPFIIINYDGLDKQLVYYCGIKVDQYQSVDLTISKGFFGFDIVRSSELKKD
jgi:hypothetical protein